MQVRVAIGCAACKASLLLDLSAYPLGDWLMHSEEPLRFFNLGNFGPRVEADEGWTE